PLWKTNYNEPPLLKTSTHFPRIILTSGQIMRHDRSATCVNLAVYMMILHNRFIIYCV
ncbi:unnamed protein product, partial [Adineta steineri]